MKKLVIALAILIAVLFVAAWFQLMEARDQWRAGRSSEAIATADRWSALHLWPSEYHQLLAAALLTAGNEAAARPQLAAIGHPWFPALDKADVARHLFARGRYADFLAYDSASQEHDSDEALLYRAAAQTITNQIDAASRTFAAIKPSGVDKQKYEHLRTAIDQRIRGVPPPFVFDRGNRVIDSDPDYAPIVLTIASRVDHNATVCAR